MPNSRRLAPQTRPQALADLEGRIAEAQRARDVQHDLVSRLVAARQDPQGARVRLQLAEERLALLQRSRAVLIDGEDQAAAGEEAEAP